jgi:hypothetical protein
MDKRKPCCHHIVFCNESSYNLESVKGRQQEEVNEGEEEKKEFKMLESPGGQGSDWMG